MQYKYFLSMTSIDNLESIYKNSWDIYEWVKCKGVNIGKKLLFS